MKRIFLVSWSFPRTHKLSNSTITLYRVLVTSDHTPRKLLLHSPGRVHGVNSVIAFQISLL